MADFTRAVADITRDDPRPAVPLMTLACADLRPPAARGLARWTPSPSPRPMRPIAGREWAAIRSILGKPRRSQRIGPPGKSTVL